MHHRGCLKKKQYLLSNIHPLLINFVPSKRDYLMAINCVQKLKMWIYTVQYVFQAQAMIISVINIPYFVFCFFFSNEKYIRFHKDFNCNYNPIPCNDRKTLWRLPDEIIIHLAPNTLLIIMKVYLSVHIIIRKVCRSDLSEKIKFFSYIFSLGGWGDAIRKTFSAQITRFSLLYSSSKSIERFTVFVYKLDSSTGRDDSRQKIFTMSVES